ncbi:MAG: class I SAM-dependent methyltransferase [Spirochaetes bacterium]|nr:class I SAM-dependent methyltransferase [Spirochaetota bacterium]
MDIELRKKYFKELNKEKKELLNKKTGLLDKKYSKEINCPLCNAHSEKHAQLFIKEGYTFVRCEECEMIFCNPQVKSQLLGELYGHSKANDIWVDIQESKKEQPWKKQYFESNLDLFNKYRNKNQRKLLDIGCSSGYFLEITNNYCNNIEAEGTELSSKAYSIAVDKGLVVHKCFLSELKKKSKYDMFTLFGVLEHLPKPFEIFNDIKLVANKNALVQAIVPNSYSLYHMFLQSNSVSFDGRNHLLYFSKNTLKKMFELNGFEILNIDTVLTGIDNIKKQMQWINPYDDINTDKYLNSTLINDFINEEYILKNDLGLRLRIIGRLKN